MDSLKTNYLLFSYFEAWDKIVMSYKKGGGGFIPFH